MDQLKFAGELLKMQVELNAVKLENENLLRNADRDAIEIEKLHDTIDELGDRLRETAEECRW